MRAESVQCWYECSSGLKNQCLAPSVILSKFSSEKIGNSVVPNFSFFFNNFVFYIKVSEQDYPFEYMNRQLAGQVQLPSRLLRKLWLLDKEIHACLELLSFFI